MISFRSSAFTLAFILILSAKLSLDFDLRLYSALISFFTRSQIYSSPRLKLWWLDLSYYIDHGAYFCISRSFTWTILYLSTIVYVNKEGPRLDWLQAFSQRLEQRMLILKAKLLMAMVRPTPTARRSRPQTPGTGASPSRAAGWIQAN